MFEIKCLDCGSRFVKGDTEAIVRFMDDHNVDALIEVDQTIDQILEEAGV